MKATLYKSSLDRAHTKFTVRPAWVVIPEIGLTVFYNNDSGIVTTVNGMDDAEASKCGLDKKEAVDVAEDQAALLKELHEVRVLQSHLEEKARIIRGKLMPVHDLLDPEWKK